jgi:ABC-type glycerol-3-phosphate transport system substrate-binding protein
MKKITIALSLLASLTILSACGGGGSSDTTTATPAPVADGSCNIVDGVYQVTKAGCKTPDNAVCTGTTVTVSSNNVTLSSGNILNINGTKYKCTGA